LQAHGEAKLVISVSLGVERLFELQKKGSDAEGTEVGVQGGKEHVGFDSGNSSRISLRLAPGSALLMAKETQEKWLHQLPAEDGAGQRISLTFRSIVPGFEDALQEREREAQMSSCT
jgi:alkylated DNA repair dioxygenase AlkB